MLSKARLHNVLNRTINNYGGVDEMRIGGGNRSTWRSPVSVPFCPPKIPYDLIWGRIRDAVIGRWCPTAIAPSFNNITFELNPLSTKYVPFSHNKRMSLCYGFASGMM
jgi:hypothetical protein